MHSLRLAGHLSDASLFADVRLFSVVSKEAKTLKNSDTYWGSFIRHRDPTLCPVGGMGLLFIDRFSGPLHLWAGKRFWDNTSIFTWAEGALMAG